MPNRSGPDDDQVYLVTSAQRAHSEEMSGRARRYLVSMGIRTICLVLAIFVLHGWLRLIAIAAALILPWLAVVLANAGPVVDDEQPEFITPSRLEIGPMGDARAIGDAAGGEDDAATEHGEATFGDAVHEQHPASETIGAHQHRTG
jgi:hypothetical protein